MITIPGVWCRVSYGVWLFPTVVRIRLFQPAAGVWLAGAWAELGNSCSQQCSSVFSTGYMIGISDADIRIALLFSDCCQILKMPDVINVYSRSIDKISVNFNFNLLQVLNFWKVGTDHWGRKIHVKKTVFQRHFGGLSHNITNHIKHTSFLFTELWNFLL